MSTVISCDVRRERRCEVWATVWGDVGERRPQAMSASGDPRREHHGGHDCPRHERWWPCMPKARAMVATATSRGTIGGSGSDVLRCERWWIRWPSVVASKDNNRFRCGASEGVLLQRPPSIRWPLRRPLIWRPRDRPPTTNYPIHVYANLWLCFMFVTYIVYMYYNDNFYGDEYDFYVCHKTIHNSCGGC
jgi:hypothetical protein